MLPICALQISFSNVDFDQTHIPFNFILQEVPEKTKESPGGPWQLVGLLPLFDPPRHDSAETIKRALNLGVNVKMITGIKESHIFSSVSMSNSSTFESLIV